MNFNDKSRKSKRVKQREIKMKKKTIKQIKQDLIKQRLLLLYKKLLKKYSYQGWWPIGGVYHPKNYEIPQNKKQQIEICLGAILVQNTSWKNAQKALLNLKKAKLLDAKKIASLPLSKLQKIIKTCGYYRQKSKTLKNFCKFYLKMKNRVPSRKELLEIWGIGPETADSILLYAYKQPEFVVDTYTKKVLIKEKIITEKQSYEQIKKLFQENLKKDYRLYNEYHALLVEEGKHLKKGIINLAGEK